MNYPFPCCQSGNSYTDNNKVLVKAMATPKQLNYSPNEKKDFVVYWWEFVVRPRPAGALFLAAAGIC